MAEGDPHPPQRDLVSGVPAELRDAGFDDVDEVGRGGFGVVYRSTQPSLDRTVAIKVLTSDLDPDNLDRFLREQRAMGRLSGHPHIVTILQVGTTSSGRPFIVMPYYAKDSLEALIRRHGPLDWSEAVRMGVKLAGALQGAHSGGSFSDHDRRDHRVAGVHRSRSPRGCDADAAIRRVLARRDAVLRNDRARGVRAPQRRKGGRPV